MTLGCVDIKTLQNRWAWSRYWLDRDGESLVACLEPHTAIILRRDVWSDDSSHRWDSTIMITMSWSGGFLWFQRQLDSEEQVCPIEDESPKTWNWRQTSISSKTKRIPLEILECQGLNGSPTLGSRPSTLWLTATLDPIVTMRGSTIHCVSRRYNQNEEDSLFSCKLHTFSVPRALHRTLGKHLHCESSLLQVMGLTYKVCKSHKNHRPTGKQRTIHELDSFHMW